MPRTHTDADKEAVRAAAIARVLTECFSDEERKQLVTEALKPLLNDRPTPYGDVEASPFKKAIINAFNDRTRKAVAEYCERPDVKDALALQVTAECERIIKERVPKWADSMIRVRDL